MASSASSMATVPLATASPYLADWAIANRAPNSRPLVLGKGKPPQFPLSSTSASCRRSESSQTGQGENGVCRTGVPPRRASWGIELYCTVLDAVRHKLDTLEMDL